MGELESQPNNLPTGEGAAGVNPGGDNPAAENLSGNNNTNEPLATADTVLRTFTGELQNIQRGLLDSLQTDMSRLQSEKTRLIDDIQRLRNERDNLIGEQHALVRQLGQVLANHISSKLESSLEGLFSVAMQRIDARVPPNPTVQNPASEATPTPSTPLPEVDAEAILQPLIQPLNQAIAQSLNQIQADLSDYQSQFSRQLAQMQDEQARGKAILGELVNRLRSELAQTPANVSPVSPSPSNSYSQNFAPNSNLDDDAPPVEYEEAGIPPFNKFESSGEMRVESTSEYIPETTIPERNLPEQTNPNPINPNQSLEASSPITSNSTPANKFGLFPSSSSPSRTQTSSRFLDEEDQPPTRENSPITLNQNGLILVGLSVIFSALYHVAIKAVFNPRSQIFGAFTIEQIVTPNLGNCLLILTLRMLVVVPLLLVLAPIMHIRVWQDLQVLFDAFRKPSQRRFLGDAPIAEIKNSQRIVILSAIGGTFLFISQASIYFAISQIPVGAAIALFFAYPITTAILAWVIQQERFNRFRLGAIAAICIGNILVLTNLGASNPGNVVLGSLSAIIAGVTFAINILLSRICSGRLHPVSYTLINFSTMMLLSPIAWLFALPLSGGIQTDGTKILEIILTAFILGLFSLGGYVFNHIGIRKFGPTGSAIAGATVPIFTVFFAGLIIQEQFTIWQILGVLTLTLGVSAFSLEKIRHRLRNQKATN